MTVTLRKPGGRVRMMFTVLTAVIAIVLEGKPAAAGPPEYMQLGARPGMALEIEGVWDAKGKVFVADDIEVLPQERLPKLRGEIQSLDKKDSTVTVYGMPVRVYERTEFIDGGGRRVDFDSLKQGMRIEVSCKFDEDRSWKARKISTKDIKASDKIKGTITRVAIDGKSPDTLDISGLLILLVDQTDIMEESGSLRRIEKELFPDIRLSDMEAPTHGIPLGRAFMLDADYRQAITSETEFDLSNIVDSDMRETEPAVRLELTAFFNEKLQGFAQLRARRKFSISSERPDTIDPPSEVDFTQLYFLVRNIATPGLAIQVGRQDFEDEREWLYDDYLDAARLYYCGVRPLVFETAYIHAVAPLKTKSETWTDIIFTAHVYPNEDNHISSYFMMRSDTDIRNREPKWYGVRYYGKVAGMAAPWLELSRMTGEDKGRTLKASAIDIGATFQKGDMKLMPSLTLGFAIGSGDEVSGDHIDNRFRQTGYEDNVGYFGGVTSVHYYSEVLDPELSNIEIVTAGVGARPITKGSIDLIYHVFKQNRPKDEITGGNLFGSTALPNGASDDLGSEIDVILGISDLWDRLSLSLAIGLFMPGDAFYPFSERAVYNRFNIKLGI